METIVKCIGHRMEYFHFPGPPGIVIYVRCVFGIDCDDLFVCFVCPLYVYFPENALNVYLSHRILRVLFVVSDTIRSPRNYLL
jgi:hypothetical protein